MAFGVQHLSGSFSSQGQAFTYEGALAYAVFPNGSAVNSPVDTTTAVLDCGVAVSQASIFGTSSGAILGYAALIQPINFPFAQGAWRNPPCSPATILEPRRAARRAPPPVLTVARTLRH